MQDANLIYNILYWRGVRVKLTWCPGQDISLFSPYRQVYGVVFNDEGKILIQRVKDSAWCLAGGTVEDGETAEETLNRELLEEADVIVKNICLLGGQRVESLDGKSANPAKHEGNDFYQLRYYCEIDKILDQTPDPDNDEIHERVFVSPDDLINYIDWGTIGKAIFDQATSHYKHLHK